MAISKEISIIIPFHNAEKYIMRCAKSILCQTYPHYKAYFIDDGSTDSSIQILSGFSDSRFIVLQQKKRGVSSARNLGLEHSQGEYVAFMDVDDELHPYYLEKLVTTAETHHIDVVICNYYRQYGSGYKTEVLMPWSNTIMDHDTICRKMIPLMICGDQEHSGIGVEVWRTLIRRTFWEKQNLWFPVEITYGEDMLFILPLYNRADAIYILEDCLYTYYQNANSLVHQTQSFQTIRTRYRDLHKLLGETLKKEELMYENRERYYARWLFFYAQTIRVLLEQIKSPFEARADLKELRQELLCEPVHARQCRYLSKKQKLKLWMLEHRMYMLLSILLWIKEKYRLRKENNAKQLCQEPKNH